MLCLVALSVGATFAADNAADVIAVDNEIVIDEPLAVEQDSQPVSANESVTSSEPVYIDNSNINQYIGGSGQIYENVTAEEFIFNGTFENLNLTVERPITLNGGIFNDPNFEIYSSNVILKNLTILQDKGYSSIFVAGSEDNHTENVTISDVAIGFTDEQNGAGAIPIQVMYSDNFVLSDSSVSYKGRTNGDYINNIIRIEHSKNALVYNNKFDAELVSVPVGWAEVPTGSGNWVSSPMSEGIVIKDSEDSIFDSNNVSIYYSNFTGAYDTIYAVDFSESNGAIITNNHIIANGYTYMYGIILSGDDFVIRANNISSKGSYYANGIDIEGPATGVVEDNNINVKAETSAYGIYSGMNGQNVSANYTGNNITGNAYNIFGFSLGDVESNVVKNYINIDGNYSTGLAARTGVLNVTENRIVSLSSEEGNETIWENFGVAARGIFAMTGNVTIDNNIIATPGAGVFLTGVDDAVVVNNFINVVANADKDAYGIYAGVLGGLTVADNNIDYEGATQGAGVNNALFISGTDGAIVANNNFTLDLVSSYVPWPEVPAGSGNWVKSPVSEGILVKWSDNVIFDGNNVNVTYGDVVGSYDTIYAVDFVESNNAVITNNNINASGNTYIYGIILSGDDFIIRANNISSKGNYYANGIDIEGPATGVVEDNVIDVNAETSAYGIYSGMNGQNVSANYTGNNITGKAYNIFGFSLGDVESNVKGNYINLNGNYTTGLAARTGVLNVTGNRFVLLSSEEGNETIWENFGVAARGIFAMTGNVTIDNNIIATPGAGVFLTGVDDAVVVNNFINVVANADKDAYGIYAGVLGGLTVADNNIDYEGATQGAGVNNALFISGTDGAIVANNNFTLDLVSSYVPWAEEPAGSGNWVSSPVSEGIVVKYSDNVIFDGNNVNVTFGDSVGSYDTIYAVDVSGDNAVITNNNINANGNSYIYGIILSGDDFIVRANNIVSNGTYYADGIDIEGPASGVVEDNVIDVKAPTTAYGIYSGMNGQNVSANYTGNTITGEAYNIFGMSIGDVEAVMAENELTLKGNYTTGIAYRGSTVTIDNNTIFADGSNIGNEPIWEAFGVETIGIKVVNGTSTIINNDVTATGKYPVDVKDTQASVHDNSLIAAKYAGDEGVANAGNSEVYNNTPVLDKISTVITITEITGGFNITGVLKDSDGNVIPNDVLNFVINGTNATVTTDENGTFTITNLTEGTIALSYDGNSYFNASTAEFTFKNLLPPTVVQIESNFVDNGLTITGYAVDTKAGEQGIKYANQLLDVNGNPISNVLVQFAVNNKIYNRTTYENGSFDPYNLNMIRAGRYTLAFSFGGNENYTSTFAVVCIDLDKKPINIKASAKSYKATAKTKKYTVTLSTIVGSSYDGKAHLRTGLKVTMKVNGKTYTGKTNKKGQVTFSLKITKKGKFAAVINYAGDNTYESATKNVKITIK